MMKGEIMEKIKFFEGDTINILAGYLKVGHISNDSAEVEEFVIDESGIEKSNGMRVLTSHDIAHELKDYDGHNHDVVLEK